MRYALLLMAMLIAPAFAEDAPLAAARRDLGKLDMVTGEAWGFADSRGAFFALAETFLAKGKESDFRKLIGDEDPIVRAMGVYCLVRAKEEAALPDLRARLGDAGGFEFVPYGCTVERATVGTLAFCLILDRNYLRARAPRRPLLAGPALADQCVTVLLRDDCADVRRYRAPNRSETWRTFTGLAAKGRAKLVGMLPKRSLSEIAKAVGRLPPDEASRAILTGILNDPKADRQARLAAASGLTADPASDALRIIEERESALNGSDPKKPGTRLVAAARLLSAKGWNPGRLHPGQLPAVRGVLNVFLKPPPEAKRKEVVRDLKTLAGDLGRFSEPWDTWSDAAYRIRSLLDGLRRERLLEGAPERPLLTEKEEKDLRRRIAPYLK